MYSRYKYVCLIHALNNYDNTVVAGAAAAVELPRSLSSAAAYVPII